MSSVDRVKAICKERKIPISRLERDLEFANGYISQLRKGVLPDDRLAKIADYLSVSADYLMNGEDTEKAPTAESERRISDDDIKIALWGTREVDDDVLEQVKTFAHFARENRKDK